MIEEGKVLGPDFWETTRAVAPIVGAVVTAATVYLRLSFSAENRKQKDEMMKEIRELFATQKEMAGLKELVGIQFRSIEARLDRIDGRPDA